MKQSLREYTITQFNADFSDNDACLNKLFELRYGSVHSCPKCRKSTVFKRVSKRQCFQCSKCYYQVYPCAGTIFEKSRIPLIVWFYILYQFTASKNGISAYEVQRQVGGTYRTCLRMLRQIRILTAKDNINWFSGTVEMDETFVGGKNINRHKNKKVPKSQGRSHKDKTPVFGMLHRESKQVRCFVVPDTSGNSLQPLIYKFVEKDSVLMTDEWSGYYGLSKDYEHNFVDHKKKIYSFGEVSSNGIENFWSIFKRTIKGSYIHVTRRYMQQYADEVAFRYNHKDSETPIFSCLLNLLASQRS